MSEGFLGRWSRRKQEVRAAEAAVEEKTLPAVEPVPAPAPLAEAAAPVAEGEQDTAPPLTLADVDALDIGSDFKPFLTKEVAPEVKNAAFRKLFADPHFNVMDGLDTYIDDYAKPSPLPDSVLRQMASAKFLNLFEERPEQTVRDDGLRDVAQSSDPGDLSSQPVADAPSASQDTDDHHADLRLQQDDAARAEDARDGAG